MKIIFNISIHLHNKYKCINDMTSHRELERVIPQQICLNNELGLTREK